MIRVRFAPSPTGWLHLGNIRTALFNYLFAKKQNGSFILRIEDTDAERSRLEYEQAIPRDLAWLGIEIDEGGERGGPHAPYRQSDRHERYREALRTLLSSGKVYPCYCSAEEIEAERKQALAAGRSFRYSGKCRGLTSEQRAQREAEGAKPSYRFRIEREIVKFDDLVYGEKAFDTANIGDFIVARSDGSPLYLFTCALDDCWMGITHVIRGEDGMSNTPRQILLQRALGLESPQFSHLPLILGPDHALLSKRNGSASVAELKAQGYVPQAVLNYLALLGWSPPDEREAMTLKTLIEIFDLSRVARHSAVFSWEKLKHLNQFYLRDMEEGEYLNAAKEFLKQSGVAVEGAELDSLLLSLRSNVQTLSELLPWIANFRDEGNLPSEDAQALREPEAQEVLLQAAGLLTGEADFSQFQDFLEQLKGNTKARGKKLFLPLRLAWTGKRDGPELADLFLALPREQLLERLKRATANL